MNPVMANFLSFPWTSSSSSNASEMNVHRVKALYNSLNKHPSVLQMLLSKRGRYAALSLAAVPLLYLAFRCYDSMPSLRSLDYALNGDTPHTNDSYNTPVEPSRPSPPAPAQDDDQHIDWSRFAYSQYATDEEYVCNSVMIFETLHRLGSKAERVLMYPAEMMDPTETRPSSTPAKLLVKARDVYNVKLQPIVIQRMDGRGSKSRFSLLHETGN
jgi:hypothetical protein